MVPADRICIRHLHWMVRPWPLPRGEPIGAKVSYCKGTDWRFSGYSDAQFITQFVSTRYIDGDIAKITATPLLEHFRLEVPDLFDGVKSTLESHARKKGTRAVSSFSASLNWWWYR